MSLSSSKSKRYFLADRGPRDNIYRYIDTKSQPDTRHLDMCAQTVDEVVDYLDQNLQDALRHKLSSTQQVNVKEILKSGSLGKSTAVKEKSDSDLIIFLDGISSIKELSELMPNILECLRNMMSEMTVSGVKTIEIKRVTKFSVGFILTTRDDSEIEMDLFPALDLTKSKSLKDIYQEMDSCDEELRQYYFSSLLPRQFEFIKESTEAVKSLIRFMKFWAKVEDVPLRSYFIELFVIFNHPNADQQSDRKPDLALHAGVRKCLHILTMCETLKITFSKNYDYRDYGKTSTSTVPYLLDPANPFMNLAPSPQKAVIVSMKAKEFLDNCISINEINQDFLWSDVYS